MQTILLQSADVTSFTLP